jgi:integrase
MSKFNPKNERIKRTYLVYLKEAKRRDEASIDAVAKALSRFEQATGLRDFKLFNPKHAIAFKRRLDEQVSLRTGERLSRATVHSTLSALRAFFFWLADQPGFRRSISYSDADYFNLSEKEVRIARACRERPFPTLAQLEHVLATMPAGTDLERRDRALIALAMLTGARDGALASFKLRHIDLAQARLDHDARDVKTKYSKTFSTWFFPVGGEAPAIVTDWVAHLRTACLWGDNDPLFRSTRMGIGPTGGFVAAGLERAHWSDAGAIRRIFRQAFEGAGLPYFHPHSIRRTLTQLGEQVCTTPEEFKAWSQNLGHEQVSTTFTSYGNVASHRQAELIRGLAARGEADGDLDDEDFISSLEALISAANKRNGRRTARPD